MSSLDEQREIFPLLRLHPTPDTIVKVNRGTRKTARGETNPKYVVQIWTIVGGDHPLSPFLLGVSLATFDLAPPTFRSSPPLGSSFWRSAVPGGIWVWICVCESASPPSAAGPSSHILLHKYATFRRPSTFCPKDNRLKRGVKEYLLPSPTRQWLRICIDKLDRRVQTIDGCDGAQLLQNGSTYSQTELRLYGICWKGTVSETTVQFRFLTYFWSFLIFSICWTEAGNSASR